MPTEVQNSKISALKTLSELLLPCPELGQVIPFKVVSAPEKDVTVEDVQAMLRRDRLRVLFRCDTVEEKYPEPTMWASMPRDEHDLSNGAFGEAARKAAQMPAQSPEAIECMRAAIVEVARTNLEQVPRYINEPITTLLNFTRPRSELALCGELILSRSKGSSRPQALLHLGWGDTLLDHYMLSEAATDFIDIRDETRRAASCRKGKIPSDLVGAAEELTGKLARFCSMLAETVNQTMQESPMLEYAEAKARFVTYKENPSFPEYYDLRIRSV